MDARLQSTVCKAIKNELRTKSFTGALKLTENFEEVIFYGVPF